jgi:Tol biopolymer transport system component
LIESTQVDSNPQYSPDGRKIAFVSDRSGTQELWLADSDGSNAARLTFLDTNFIGSAAWSLDSQFLTFSSPVRGSADVYFISAKGGFATRVTSAVGDERFPTFSRDGRWIYFSSRKSGSDQVWRIPREGGAWIQMMGGPFATRNPEHSADG